MGRVLFLSDCLESDVALKAAIQPWADVNGWDVGLWNAHGSQVQFDEASRDSAYTSCVRRIMFWANPEGTESSGGTRYTQVFGRLIGVGQRDGTEPAEALHENIVDSAGKVVAQLSVDKMTMYVLFDLPHEGNDDRVTRYVMEQLLIAWDNIVKGADSVRTSTVGPVVDHKDLLQKLLNAHMGTAIAKKERELRDAKTNEQSYVAALTAATRAASDILAMLNGLKSRPVDGAVEYDKILKVEKVKSVSVSGNVVNVETKEIPFTYVGRKYDSGPYTIKISVNNGNIVVTSPNVHEYYCHPHVYASDGRPCFGNVGAGIVMLVGTFELAAAVAMIIQFLENCGESDWYLDPKKWAAVPEVVPTPIEVVSDAAVDRSVVEEEEEYETCEICDNSESDCTCWRCRNCERLRAEDAWRCEECERCERCCDGEHEHEYDHGCGCESCKQEKHDNCECDSCIEYRHTECSCAGCEERRNECECAVHVEQRTYGNREHEQALPLVQEEGTE